MGRFLSGLFVLLMPVAVAAAQAGGGVADELFVQEYAEVCMLGEAGTAENDVRALAVGADGEVWAATEAGPRVWRDGAWHAPEGSSEAAPAFAVHVDGEGGAWIGAWDGLYRVRDGRVEKHTETGGPVSAIGEVAGTIVAATPEGIWRISGARPERVAARWSGKVGAVVGAPDGAVWLATGTGAYRMTGDEGTLYQDMADIVSASVSDIAVDRDEAVWIGGLGGISVMREGRASERITPSEGLPSVYVSCLAHGPDGRVWIGTDLGVARFGGGGWSLRHDRRWLPDNEVRDIVFDTTGAAWIATANGVGVIRARSMTLEEKAAHYQKALEARHVRPPYLVGDCVLKTAGDLETWTPRDDDNDGQYTSMYLAMESFRYAATKDPGALENARAAFRGLRFLQEVTQTPGFVARTVIPSDWKTMADPNETTSDEEYAERLVHNPRVKRVENRWRPSADGKWLWKGDTSSDEITGHMYGYLMYYELAADETERKEVAALVARIMDYIIEGGLVLKDIDGAHTTWGVWAPERLNDDPNWRPERGVNSVEILSYLNTAYHMTGDAKYKEKYRELVEKHHYAENARACKTFNPAWRTHIDDELLALAFPGLFLEEDPALLALYREGLESWYGGIERDESPYFEFMYVSLGSQGRAMEAALGYLRDTSLDLIRWTMDNTRREDIELVRAPEIEPQQTSRMLPASERDVMRWDKNPWAAVQGAGGVTERTGAEWLLPYWMGRYYGFIRAAGERIEN